MLVRQVGVVTAGTVSVRRELQGQIRVRAKYEQLKNKLATFKAKRAAPRHIAEARDAVRIFKELNPVPELTLKALREQLLSAQAEKKVKVSPKKGKKSTPSVSLQKEPPTITEVYDADSENNIDVCREHQAR
jgi:hypothetical protein